MNCLIVDKMHESLIPMLKEIGVDATYEPDITREEIKAIIPNFEGLIIRSKTIVDNDLLANAKRLKFVGRAGSGLDNIDQPYLSKKGIAIFNAPEANKDSVGEHTIGLILSLLHNLHKAHAQISKGSWNRETNRGVELGNRTVGIIGYGHTGSSLAKKLQSFGCKVIAYDKYHPQFKNSYAQSVSLQELQHRTDILSLHIPLTEETRRMITDDFLRNFRKNIIFINTSRGEIASFQSIIRALKSGKVIQAGLDVLENELFNTFTEQQSLDMEWLIRSEKVIFTPHVAGWTVESYQRINKVLVQKIHKHF